MLGQPQRIGSYEVLERLAAGGMGVVYVAQHATFGEKVAIKVLMESLVSNERVRFRFEQEAYVQRHLGHPNIVEVKDFLSVDGTLAIVMELVVGPSLQQVCELEQPGPWSPEAALAFMDPIAEALGWAHGRGVIHRDLKPANILMDRSAPGSHTGVPKITDFGLAKVLSSRAGLSIDGNMMGTLPYMAPEQFAGRTDIDARADVFALGMMWRRMLVGHIPLDPDNMLACAEFYSGKQPLPPLLQEAPGIPPTLAEVIEFATAIDPSQRPPDAAVLARLIRQGLKGLSPTRPPPEPGSRPVEPRAQPSQAQPEAPATPRSPPPGSPAQAAVTPGSPPTPRDEEIGFAPARRSMTGPLLAVGAIGVLLLLGVMVVTGLGVGIFVAAEAPEPSWEDLSQPLPNAEQEAPQAKVTSRVPTQPTGQARVETEPSSPVAAPAPPPAPTIEEELEDFFDVYYGRFNAQDLDGWTEMMRFPVSFWGGNKDRNKLVEIYSNSHRNRGGIRVETGGLRVRSLGGSRYKVWIDSYKVYFNGRYDADNSRPVELEVIRSASAEHGFLVSSIKVQGT